MPQFEVYRRQRAPVTPDPTVTIQKRGTFSINAAAFRALEEPKAVELLFDRSQRLLGMRKVDPEAEHAYLVRAIAKTGRNSTWVLSGTAFTAYYGIPTEVSKRYVAQLIDGVLTVDLKQPGKEVTSNRAGAPQSAQERLPDTLL